MIWNQTHLRRSFRTLFGRNEVELDAELEAFLDASVEARTRGGMSRDDRNRERINLAADEKGGAHIRFLDRRTNVVSRVYLDDQNRVGWVSPASHKSRPPFDNMAWPAK
jgi:hypothetical protein